MSAPKDDRKTEDGEAVRLAQALRRDSVFFHKNEALIDALAGGGRIMTCAKGQVLFMQDDVAGWFYVVESGWVKIFRETLDGDEVITDVLPAGSMFGETAIFSNSTYAGCAEIIEPATIHVYPLPVLGAAVRRDPSLALAMLEHVCRQNSAQALEIEHRSVQNAAQRVGCFLLKLCGEYREGHVTLHLPYDKTVVAARLGMQPETFSRALSRLQADTGLRVKGASITIDDLDILIRYTCSACSNAFPCEDH